MTNTLTANGRDIEITHGDKELFPNAHITKYTFVQYYYEVADTMLPYMQDRPVTMHRFPGGIDTSGFYHKNTPEYFPKWIQTQEIEKKEGGTTTYVICNDTATLVYLANYGCITPHIWLSTIHHITKADRLIFDLDPPENKELDVAALKHTAYALKDILEGCNLTPFIMTTGSRGFHIVTPIKPEYGFDPARAFAERVADVLTTRYPEQLTTAIRKANREGRIFIDINRIAYAQTGAAPYAVRAKAGAPIATPLAWHELERSDLHPQSYTIDNIFRRLGQIEDPWKNMHKQEASLTDAQEYIDQIENA